MESTPAAADVATDVRLLDARFDPARELADFHAAHAGSGGIVSFLGQVRGQGTELLELRHYAPLTLPGMRELAQLCLSRWQLDGMLILHRTGQMGPGEPIVLVAAAAPHRRKAFAATDYAMDHLKSESWFWKRERRGGSWQWIEPRPDDYAAVQRWG
jgi:molybdopterin synthase catalytic subunit